MSCSNIANITATISDVSFWNSVDILIKKPHVVNKRLWGSKTLFRDTKAPDNLPLYYERIKNINNIQEYIDSFYENLNVSTDDAISNIQFTLLELLPRTYNENHAFQIVILNKEIKTALFYDVTPSYMEQNLCPTFSYSFKLHENGVQLEVESVYLFSEPSSKSYQWLKDTVLPHLIKWATENFENECHKQICNESLSLVSIDKYYSKYNELKIKHGREMVKIWPECTDPSKFVYEDIAIATYLLLLWEDERRNHNLINYQTFVDLGCGNGLLVYILIKEGHKGVGIDIRRRQIWGMYPPDVKLEVKTVTPSDAHLFPETDWLIGNHSDELTPWIPVIAARSSYKCNFFLLPCCAYNFDGSKYQRQNSSISQYTEYLQYIKQVCEDCGFQTVTDRLKIPSTKRICHIGIERTYPIEEYDQYCNRIQNLISVGSSAADVDCESLWIRDFKAREATEKVKNCTQLDKSLIEKIVEIISKHLLHNCNLESVWSIGKTVGLREVINIIPKDKLKALKSECGGLQTLLKNNHHIFKVQSGTVQLRYPKTVEEVYKGQNKTNNVKIQQKPCWFYNNHPQGCPLTDLQCSFLHIKSW
ncbi:probable tRNA (uracil-O(2)-)-methyltransferase isoform X1 [Hyposmocoma kahamanoa]|uniref:probable tRNA (uracil-O(2)-)-methyltransferase isoform X1 n=1 Tax=Hyposmocoma kahamanoa TaxID=1477025 RepID=UPI000E6D8210|nr:probable tRNA (uracil-O(2)-)-methyltransferase isoform X1 [Hyposmocoma kahamanoa]